MSKTSDFDSKLIETLFIKYAKVNTRSDANSHTVPTTVGQVKLAKTILSDLQNIGIEDAEYEPENSYVLGTLPSNSDKDLSPIGFIAHMDTADFNAENVKPQIHQDYDGRDIVLNKKEHIILSPKEFPLLKNYVGQRVITTDGTTLLGADDKAGVAAIFGALNYFLEHPEVEHGEVKVAFGPDEEIGRGAKRFPAEKFGTEFAYTLDNGQPGQIEAETFNASEAQIDIKGTAVHPGNAFGLMVNAVTLANEIISALPKDEVAEKSSGHQGFILVTDMNATIAKAHINLIIREFDTRKYHANLALLQRIVDDINSRFDSPRIVLQINEQYRNIGDTIRKYPYIVNLVLDVYRRLNIKPNITPFRGGTDGNAITAKGIPTPNLFNGGDNFHGPYEYVSTEAMTLAAQVVTEIVKEHVRQFRKRDEKPIKLH
ncbi:Peptidase T [Lentilactobacillus parabuchneri]|uniref:Peptidase T n=1 Tax=Lentilactobacillus parabuchneri TaxID=152331 RepID=A0A1X1FHK0_9LACO|nr:peptidase T [Lentilactobacillus parabuchneri]APR06587.1 Peptidase T [Lentilactobacillus parabuchneri]MBW0223339.1 peptidase T [Lentilactobacillus parabuchneri]MBW0246266.1 peptidase T [Lentilactobacillus parabuchneri]MDG9737931.1 peptidase T [Lentilactobacillus parabuchneri]OBU96517.1 peptidase T [Lentilactobacillus parabuchneri]